MKRILALILAMLMICFAFAACSTEEDEDTEGGIDLTVTDSDSVYNTKNEHNDQFYYDYINGDEVIITGYAGSHIPHAITVPDVIDERPVTAISACAFLSKTNVTEVTLPATVNAIGNMAFAKCSNLTKINVPDAVISVGDAAFAETAIVEIKLPATLVTLGESVFANCGELTKAELPAGKEYMLDPNNPEVETVVSVVPSKLFMDCTKLAQVTWTSAADRIDAYAFANCKVLTTVPTLSDKAFAIGEFAFLGCAKIAAVTIPATMTEIGECAFYGCAELASVTFTNIISIWDVDHADPNKVDQRFSAGADLADLAENAKKLTDTYAGYTWKVVTR